MVQPSNYKNSPHFSPLIILTCGYVLIIFFIGKLGYFSRDFKTTQPIALSGKIVSLPQIYPEKFSFLLAPDKKSTLKNYEKVWLTLPTLANRPGDFTIGDFVKVKGEQIEKLGLKKSNFLWRWAGISQKQMSRVFDKFLPGRESAILKMMIVGDKTQLTADLKKIFVDSGTIHVLIVSGMNVAYYLFIFYWLFRLLRVSKKLFSFLILPLLFFYCLICGANPPVVRAAIMAGVGLLCYFLERERNTYRCLAIAALVILLISPRDLFSISFQLSFLACWGLIYLSPFLEKKFYFIPTKIIRQLFSTTFAAQLSCLPLLVFYFNRVSLIGFFSNLIIVPWAGIVFSLGLVLFLVSLVSSYLATIFSALTYPVVHYFDLAVNFFAQLPFSALHLSSPSEISLAGIYCFLFLLPKIKTSLISRKLFYTAVLLWGGFYISGGLLTRQDMLKITFFAAGKGAAIYLQFPNGQNMLIDGGERSFGKSLLTDFLVKQGRLKLDYLVLTHPHYSHYAGLLPVAENFSIGKALFSPHLVSEPEYLRFSELLTKKKVPIRQLWAGDRIYLGKVGLKIINPEYLSGDPDKDSLAILLEYNKFSFLFTGGLGIAEVNRIARSLPGLTGLQIPAANHWDDFSWSEALEFGIMTRKIADSNSLPKIRKIWNIATSGSLTIDTNGESWRIKGKH